MTTTSGGRAEISFYSVCAGAAPFISMAGQSEKAPAGSQTLRGEIAGVLPPIPEGKR